MNFRKLAPTILSQKMTFTKNEKKSFFQKKVDFCSFSLFSKKIKKMVEKTNFQNRPFWPNRRFGSIWSDLTPKIDDFEV